MALAKIDQLLTATLDLDKDNNESKAPDNDDIPKRVLSIQSTVVYGICGNKSAMFPLQLHGFDVSPMNTVQFSNHTAYPNKWTGTITTGKQIDELVDGLQANNLFTFPYLITGYMGGIDCLSHLNKLIQSLKTNLASNSDALFYACDPVMGDNGQLYAPSFKPFIDVYKNEIIQHARLLTPNQTEAAFLLDMAIESLADAYKACDKFHDIGIRYVVITSVDIPNEPDTMYCVYSDKMKKKQYGHVKLEKIKGYWVGTGDLTTAMLFAWITKNPNDLGLAVQNTMSTVKSIITRSKEHESFELLLVGKKAMDNILNPRQLPKTRTVDA
eukprot:774411_1